MKVVIKDVTARGLELFESVEADALGLSTEDLKCLSPLTIKAEITRAQDIILAHVQIQGRCSFFCNRCLEPVESDRSLGFDLDYAVEKGLESIDLAEDIRQEIILSSPAKVLCRKDCKGICPRCGVNLNKEQCRCK